MATQIVIANGESITVDNDYLIEWADKALQILPDDIIAVKISVKVTGDRTVVLIL